MGFVHTKFLLIWLLVLIVLALQIIGAATPWYEYKFGQSGGKAVATLTEYLTYSETDVPSIKYSSTCKYTDDDCVGDQVKAMYGIIFACILVAIVLTAIEALILTTWAFHFCKRLGFRGKLRIPLIVIAVLATLATLGAWAVLFWHPDAVKSDTKLKVDFVSDDSNPHAGWALTIVASALSILATICICASGSPDHHGYLLFR